MNFVIDSIRHENYGTITVPHKTTIRVGAAKPTHDGTILGC